MAVRVNPAHATLPPPTAALFAAVALAIIRALDWPEDSTDVRDAALVAAKAAYGALAVRSGARTAQITGLECDYDEGRT